jgi:hypothetical protein
MLFELATELGVVINLPVEDQRIVFVFRENRLRTGLYVDDLETSRMIEATAW